MSSTQRPGRPRPCNERTRVKWIDHSCRTYHFSEGYLLKLRTCQPLRQAQPKRRKCHSFEILHMYFPTLYDIKYLVQEAGGSLKRQEDCFKLPITFGLFWWKW
eukprot:Filipodium_phascolosomae@DN2699_c0_g1_i1.p1